jgi:hypothetical protein
MAVWTSQEKNTSSFSSESKHTSSFTGQSKSASSFTGQSKNTGTWDNGLGHLLQELGYYILQENGGKIVLQESWNFVNPIIWTDETKH